MLSLKLLTSIVICFCLMTIGCKSDEKLRGDGNATESIVQNASLPTHDVLERVKQSYERGPGQIPDTESDQLMDDLGVLGRRAGAGDTVAFRGLAALPLDGAYGEVAIMAVNSNDNLKECPVPTTEDEADLVLSILFLMEPTEALEKEYEKMEASAMAENILEVGVTRGLRYGGYRSWLNAKLVQTLEAYRPQGSPLKS